MIQGAPHPLAASPSRAIPTSTILAFGYARCSTAKQDKSIPEQKAAVSDWAARCGYSVVAWFDDDGISGSTFEGRPGFQAMLTACRGRGEAKAVLVWDKSRFGRPGEDPREASFYEREIHKAGMTIVYVASNRISKARDFTSAIVDSLENAMAADFVIKHSATMTRHNYENARQGYSTGRKPPFGYDLVVLRADGTPRHRVRYVPAGEKNKYRKLLLDPVTGALRHEVPPDTALPRLDRADRSRLVLGDAAEVRTVEEIYDRYLRGEGFKVIAGALNAARRPAPNARCWYTTAVREILMNPAYTGDMVAGRRAEGKFHTMKKGEGAVERTDSPEQTRKGNAKVEWRERADWIVVPDLHPAIIPRATRERAQETRGGRHRQRVAGRKSVFRLTGLVVCGKCGHKLTGMSRVNGKGVWYRNYVCSARYGAGKSVCDSFSTVRHPTPPQLRPEDQQRRGPVFRAPRNVVPKIRSVVS